ncbi:MAG TPA: hypothetical protein VHR45_12550 [Thermoanaerobaculia bacterium]|nr:hypothetical protein [Thermoanaerobaculia bacterium]
MKARSRSGRRSAVLPALGLLAALALLLASSPLPALRLLPALFAVEPAPPAPATPATSSPAASATPRSGPSPVAAPAPASSAPEAATGTGVAGAAAAGAPRADELRGRIELVGKDGKSAARGSDPSHAVVYFEPAVPSRAMRPPETPFKMVTRHKEFEPLILALPRGSRVIFPNEDPILHNVFSVSGGNQFDLGLYRQGPGKEKRFELPGLVRVYCNVHQNMVAYILVLETPYYTAPAADGSFALRGLPKGPGRLNVWHEQTEVWTAPVTLPAAAQLRPRPVVVRPLLPPHLNKVGESYYQLGRDRYQKR